MLLCSALEAPYALGDVEQSVVAVYLRAHGKEKGSMLLVLTEEVATPWNSTGGSGGHCGDREHLRFGLLERHIRFPGNHHTAHPSGVAVGMLSAVMEYLAMLVSEDYYYLVIIKTHFITEQQKFPAYFIYIPDRETEKPLIEKFGIQ
jgi:chemotaxis protein CheY-P-specific phosphatase CheC